MVCVVCVVITAGCCWHRSRRLAARERRRGGEGACGKTDSSRFQTDVSRSKTDVSQSKTDVSQETGIAAERQRATAMMESVRREAGELRVAAMAASAQVMSALPSL